MKQASVEANQLRDIITRLDELPTLPVVISKITNLMQNPRTSAGEVGQAITTDQSLTGKTLKLVNSAFYGFPGRISTVTHAIVILGFNTVKNIVLTTSILNVFNKRGRNQYFDLEAFWIHSIATGAAAKVLASQTNPKLAEEAFIGGLLHDIGKVVLSQFAREDFEKVAAYRDENNSLLLTAEKETLGITHQEIGAWLGEKWNLPRELTAAMQYHHRPEVAGIHQELASMVHVADILVRAMGFGSGGDQRIPLLDPSAWNLLGMDKFEWAKLLEKVETEVDKASIFMEVI